MAANWITCQIGSRELYAVPRALHQHRRLRCLITDVWTNSRAVPTIRHRFHRDLATACVESFTLAALIRESVSRLRDRQSWDGVMTRNAWFQRRAIQTLQASSSIPDAGAGIIFAYSYAALEIFKWAKRHGWRTVLGQIDAGPREEEIVQTECRATADLKPIWSLAPKRYWELWSQECALADSVLVNSTWSRECLAASGVSHDKMKIVPLAYEFPYRDVAPSKTYPSVFTPERPLRILFLGQFNIRKGAARLLAAARLLETAPVEFWIVGPVQFHDDARESRRNLRWVGPVPNTESTRYYRDADVFILPTLSDGFALTQLEAMAHQLPVIASRNCGEVVRHNIDGIVLPEVTSDAIVGAIMNLLSNPNLLPRMAQNADVRPEFSVEALGANLACTFD